MAFYGAMHGGGKLVISSGKANSPQHAVATITESTSLLHCAAVISRMLRNTKYMKLPERVNQDHPKLTMQFKSKRAGAAM